MARFNWIRARRWVKRLILLVAVVGGVVALLRWYPGAFNLAKPTNAEELWALIGTFVNVAVLIVAFYGLKSLALTRHSMLTQAHRDARACAIARCEEYANEIIPANGPILDSFAAHGVPVFVKEASDVQFDPDDAAHLENAIAWMSQVPDQIHGDCISLLNRLEAWAMYFTSQLADPKVAFGPCGPHYCSLVVQMYGFLVVMRNRNKSSGKYPNIVKLFKGWMEQLEEEKRGLTEGALLALLRNLQTKGSHDEPGLTRVSIGRSESDRLLREVRPRQKSPRPHFFFMNPPHHARRGCGIHDAPRFLLHTHSLLGSKAHGKRQMCVLTLARYPTLPHFPPGHNS